MKRSSLITSSPCSTPGRESSEVLAVSQILQDGDKEVLNIDLFYFGELKARYFASLDECRHYAWCGGKWNTNTIDNVARKCIGDDVLRGAEKYYCSANWEFASKEDKEIAYDFLDTYSVEAWEGRISTDNYLKALNRKAVKIRNMMSEVPTVPDGVEHWLKSCIFPEQFVFAKRDNKRTNYNCTACGANTWTKKILKHGQLIKCPKCGQSVKVLTRQQDKRDETGVVIIQSLGKEWIERQFTAVCLWHNGKKEISMYEQIRVIIPQGNTWGKVWYGQLRQADEFEQEYWDSNQSNKRFVESYLYPGNLGEVLPCGKLEHSGIDILANKQKKFNVNKFIATFHERPWVEYLIKGGFYNLSTEIIRLWCWWGNPSAINTKANGIKELLKLDGDRVSRLRVMDGGIHTLEWLQYEMSKGVKVSQEVLSYLDEKKVYVDDCKEILRELKSVNRMVNYMRRQKIHPSKLVGTWRDYLRMAADEGMDTTDDIVRFPKNLKARHDELVERINARRDAERMAREAKKYRMIDNKIIQHLPEVQKYFWQDDIYMIVPAGRCQELIDEGRALHHCVGASDVYMNKMAAGTSWILFLRKRAEPEKPYYTIEINVKDDRIIQWYSEFDRKPDEKTIKNVLTRFKKQIKKVA